jgi:hypothetical protein
MRQTSKNLQYKTCSKPIRKSSIYEVTQHKILEKRNAYRRILMGKPERKRSLRRSRRRWVDNIKMGLREIGWGAMDWIDLAQDRD